MLRIYDGERSENLPGTYQDMDRENFLVRGWKPVNRTATSGLAMLLSNHVLDSQLRAGHVVRLGDAKK